MHYIFLGQRVIIVPADGINHGNVKGSVRRAPDICRMFIIERTNPGSDKNYEGPHSPDTGIYTTRALPQLEGMIFKDYYRDLSARVDITGTGYDMLMVKY